MIIKKINELGMELLEVKHKSCLMTVAEGDDWISVYTCECEERGKGHATEAINLLKKEFPNKRLCGSVPLNDAMKRVYEKCGVHYER